MPPECLLGANLPDQAIALHLFHGLRYDADMHGDVSRLSWPIESRDRLFRQLCRPARRQPRHPRPAVLEIEAMAGRCGMEREQRPRIPLLAGPRAPAPR